MDTSNPDWPEKDRDLHDMMQRRALLRDKEYVERFGHPRKWDHRKLREERRRLDPTYELDDPDPLGMGDVVLATGGVVDPWEAKWTPAAGDPIADTLKYAGQVQKAWAAPRIGMFTSLSAVNVTITVVKMEGDQWVPVPSPDPGP